MPRVKLLTGWLVLTGILAFIFSYSLVAPAYAKDTWGIYAKAQQAAQNGNYTEAIRFFQEIIPDFIAGGDDVNIALMYGKMADAQAALQQYDNAVKSWDAEAAYWGKAGKVQSQIAAARKADGLRSTVQLFTQVDAQSLGNPIYHGAKYEPRAGALLGAYAENDPAMKFYMEDFPQLVGKPQAAFLLYSLYDQDIFVGYKKHLEYAKAHHIAVQLALQPSQGLDEVQDNAYLHKLAQEAKAAGIPIFLRFANEMNGDWVPWYGDPQKYIEKFRLVSKVFKAEADNVAMVWAPGYFPPENIEDYYPGDDYVDWVGVSIYQVYNGALDPLEQGVDRSNFIGKFDHIYNLYAARKPLLLSEGAVSYTDPLTGKDLTPWAIYQTKQFYATLPMLYPGVKAVYWFDVRKEENGRTNTYLLSGNPTFLDAFKASIASPYYLSAVGDESPVAYQPVGKDGFRPANFELSAYITTWQPMIDRVAYLINGQEVGQASGPPWTINVDLARYNHQNVRLTVRAYDVQGKLLTESTENYPVGTVLSDIANHWARDQIYRLVDAGIANGFTDGTYRPDQEITREQFTTLLIQAMQLPISQTADSSFSDVPSTRWSASYIEAALQVGILQKEEIGNQFKPAQAITRSDMAVMAARALKLPEEESALNFLDNPAITAHRGLIGATVQAGIIQGFDDKTFRPDHTATRAQAAAMIGSVLDAMAGM